MLSFVSFNCYSQEIVPASNIISTNVDVSELDFYKFNTKNFEVLSTSESLSESISKKVEEIKEWVELRWQLQSVDLSKPCMIICLSPEMMEKVFSGTEYEAQEVVSQRNEGEVDVFAIWISSDKINQVLSEKITQVVLMNLKNQKLLNYPDWYIIGSSYMNANVSNIREGFKSLKPANVADILDGKIKDKNTLAAFCFFLRKGGVVKSFDFIVNKNPQEYGYESMEQFNQSFNHFLNDLAQSASNPECSDYYFTWFSR